MDPKITEQQVLFSVIGLVVYFCTRILCIDIDVLAGHAIEYAALCSAIALAVFMFIAKNDNQVKRFIATYPILILFAVLAVAAAMVPAEMQDEKILDIVFSAGFASAFLSFPVTHVLAHIMKISLRRLFTAAIIHTTVVCVLAYVLSVLPE